MKGTFDTRRSVFYAVKSRSMWKMPELVKLHPHAKEHVSTWLKTESGVAMGLHHLDVLDGQHRYMGWEKGLKEERPRLQKLKSASIQSLRWLLNVQVRILKESTPKSVLVSTLASECMETCIRLTETSLRLIEVCFV